MDAFATPFVQGRLRGKPLVVVVHTECAHCSKSMEIEIDSNMSCQMRGTADKPFIFVPEVDVHSLAQPSIIESF